MVPQQHLKKSHVKEHGYVDDLIVTGADTEEIGRFKQQIVDKFRMSDLGLLHFYLGIKFQQNTSGIVLSQGAYASRLLE
jgi:hypothetical protein